MNIRAMRQRPIFWNLWCEDTFSRRIGLYGAEKADLAAAVWSALVEPAG